MSPWAWALASTLAGLAAPPLIAGLRTRRRARARAGLPGEILPLSDGRTRVTTDGLPGRPVAVMVHGLTTPSWVFDPVAEGLGVQGWRVLRYDLWGRGGSDTPRAKQDKALFLRQLSEVIDAQAPEGPVLLVGYSMGGAIAAAYAAEHPERVRGLALLAPAGLGLRMDRFTRFCTRTPVLGDWLWAGFSGIGMRRAARRAAEAESPSALPDITRRLAAETRTRGYRRAVLSSLRHMLAEEMSHAFKTLALRDMPILAVWGEDDRVIARAARNRLKRLVPQASQVVVPGAAHGLPHTHPRAVLKALAEFTRLM